MNDKPNKILTETEFNEYLKTNDLHEARGNQYKFYLNFANGLMDNDKSTIIVPGRMGLGKSVAALIALMPYLKSEEVKRILIITPHSSLRKGFCEECNKIPEVKNIYAEWLPRSEMEIPLYGKNYEDTNDSTIGKQHLEGWSNGKTYSADCIKKGVELKFPLDIDKFYKSQGVNAPIYEKFVKTRGVPYDTRIVDCATPIVRSRILNAKIIVGDYFACLNSGTYRSISGYGLNDTFVVCDEVHILPRRVINHNSKTISINRLLEDIQQDDKINQYFKNRTGFNNSIDIIREIVNEKIDQIKKEEQTTSNGKKEKRFKEKRFDFIDFKREYKEKCGEYDIDLDHLLSEMSMGIGVIYPQIKKEYEDRNDPTLKKLYDFIAHGEKTYDMQEYAGILEYQTYKVASPRLSYKILCIDPGKYLDELQDSTKKFVGITGTIKREDANVKFRLDKRGHEFYEMLESYDIKHRIIFHDKDDFTRLKYRVPQQTLTRERNFLLSILADMSNKQRVLIGVPSLDFGKMLGKFLEDECGIEKPVINLCQSDSDNGDSTVPIREFEYKKGLFNDMSEGIGILNVKGRVTGQNFLDTSGVAVENILIMGYPFPNKHTLLYEIQKKYYKSLKQGQGHCSVYAEREAEEIVSLNPNADDIFQFIARSSRCKNTKPRILLWGNHYNINQDGYKYLDDKIKGQIISSKDEVIKKIREMRDEI